MKKRIPADQIKGVECKYATYQEATDGSGDDVVLIKEVIHTKDGKQYPNIRLVENYQRPFYITKPNYRNHQDKKEYEDIEKLTKYECTQSQMVMKIQQALGRRVPSNRLQLRDVCDSPYVYFADITTPTLIKAKYKNKWPELTSRNKVAILDIETDVVFGTEEPIMVSITMGKYVMVGIAEWWAKRIQNVDKQIREKYEKYLSVLDIKDDDAPTGRREINLTDRCTGEELDIFVGSTPGEMLARTIRRCHDIMPDFLAIWNINFDIPKILKVFEKEKMDLTDIFCDPKVPEKYRKVKYREAKAQRETASKTIAQHPADLWHILHCQAGFYVIDAMCAFKKIRVANGNEPSYSLDNILKKHLGIGKLKFEEVEGDGDLKWHIDMQTNYPVEYIIYNIFDCMSIELLDEKTNDLASTVSALCDISEYAIFPSLPKRLVDILTYFYLDRGKVPGTVGTNIKHALDEDVIEMTEWIVTLPAHMVEDTGLNCIEEIPALRTMMRVQTADDDITQAYPSGGLVLNISKETTLMEICGIDGVSEQARRRAGVNLTGGKTNAIEICNDIMNMPYIHDVLDLFEQDMKDGLV